VGYDREEDIMHTPDDLYAEFITRKRWPLCEAAWLVNGVFLHTTESFGTFMEQWYGKKFQEKFNEELEAGRLPKDYVEQMLRYGRNTEHKFYRVNPVEELPKGWHEFPYDMETGELADPEHEAHKAEQGMNHFMHQINLKGEISQCVLPYVTEDGTWMAVGMESEWDSEYLLKFAEAIGIDVDWLREDIQKHSNAPTPQAISLITERTNMHIQVTGVEAKGEVGEIPKPKHKFRVGKANSLIPKQITKWLETVRDNGEPWPKNQADRFLKWFADTKPVIPFVEIEEVTGSHIKYWNLDASGKRLDNTVNIYNKNQINGRIEALCKTEH
jgi:hypothetical protein